MHRVIHPGGTYLLSYIIIQRTHTDVEHDVSGVTYVAYYIKIDPRQVTTSIDSRGSGYVAYYPHYSLFSLRYEPPIIYWYRCPIDGTITYTAYLYYAGVVDNVIARRVKVLYVADIDLCAETATFCYLVRRHYLHHHCLRRRRRRRDAWRWRLGGRYSRRR